MGKVQSYLWDGNASAFVDGTPDDVSGLQYYLQDDLGSPIRLADAGGVVIQSYGYDEFGQDLYGNGGMIQPFGFTGYEPDAIAGTAFAQAREYVSGLGRFAGMDVISGFQDAPFTMNRYGYCFNSPLLQVDATGAWPEFEDVVMVGSALLFVGGATALSGVVNPKAGVIVATSGTAGAIMAVNKAQKTGKDIEDEFYRGAVDGTVVGAGVAIDLRGAIVGMIGQVISDETLKEERSFEKMAGASVGGAIGTKNVFAGSAAATNVTESLQLLHGIEEYNIAKISWDTSFSGIMGLFTHSAMPEIRMYITSLTSRPISDIADAIIENTLTGILNGIYGKIVNKVEEC